MHNYRELRIWQNAVDLAVKINRLTKTFPKEELYGLSSQIRRCSVSISSNIAEGAFRNSNNEFVHFLGIANGSAAELDTQLYIAQKSGYVSPAEYGQLRDEIDHIQKMNFRFMTSLRSKSK